MKLLSTHEASRVRNLALSALYHIAAEQQCEVPDIIALITPSQPGEVSRSHAPAADTPVVPAGVMADGEAVCPASPSAEPIPEAPKPLPVASVVPDDARPTEAKTSAEDVLSSASGGVQGGLPAHPATPSPETADKAGDEVDHVAMNAADHGQDGTGNDATDGNPGGENEVAHPSFDNSANDAADEGGQRADAGVLGSAVEAGAPPPKRAPSPSDRFYIRDALGRYVHQGLEPSPSGTGPLMTSKRVYAWFGTRKQFMGAAKRWPELNGMRRIRPQS